MKQSAAPCAFTSAESWVILNPIEQSIKQKIEKIGKPLKEWDVQIYRGVLTGCNEAFIIDEATRNAILENCKTADERKRTEQLIRPILRGRDIKRYSYEWANLYLIATFPALHLDINDYPAVRDYLLAFGKERLEQTGKTHVIKGVKVKSRKKTCNQWFETQDAIAYWDDFDKPKIVWGEISDKTKFALDSKGDFMEEATSFLLIGEDLEWLVCFLNSPLSEYLFSKIGTTTGVGTVRWKKFKLEQLYVPTSNIDVAFFKKSLQAYLKTDDESFLTNINRKIYAICDLSPEEISFVESQLPATSAISSVERP